MLIVNRLCFNLLNSFWFYCFREKSYLAIKASNQWKLKTKLESAGIAALCLASDQSYENPIFNSCMLIL